MNLIYRRDLIEKTALNLLFIIDVIIENDAFICNVFHLVAS